MNDHMIWAQSNAHRFPVVNQPVRTPAATRQKAEAAFLPALRFLWFLVEQYTGHRWRATSYWRESPSHRHGYALDIAPDIAPQARPHYAFYKRSDPVLYKREPLLRQLQALATDPRLSAMKWPFTFSVAVEPDHLHLSLFSKDAASNRQNVSILKWKVPKDVYSDTRQRMNLPLWTPESKQFYRL